ncbi:hypothetical protein [Marinomonas algarum]|uniref:Uncharacterized protein n=1 Tax=Marinomonas algarum TaxID=2883105 RepID=A0A9X1RUI3_9GAMM|nr:hypothetical protein [Marinomonas algarum]MCB5163163.1 hypothetical protein [Marinomonas algarum]
MMTLTTVCKPISSLSATVFWRVGSTRNGILNVTLKAPHEDSALVCELVAIQHLIFKKEVFFESIFSGKGCRLVVSKGAIRKLALGRSNKTYAEKYAAFLDSRLEGVKIEVSQKMEFMASEAECEVEHIRETKIDFNIISTPAIGDVRITKHAFEQYKTRITSGDPKRPYKSLVKRLNHPELHIRSLNDRVIAHKTRKYGRSDNIELWTHVTSVFNYLIVRDDAGNGTLVTVFERNGSFEED